LAVTAVVPSRLKDKKDAESLAVVPGDPQPPEKEGGNNPSNIII
jgi:hypothetical protein